MKKITVLFLIFILPLSANALIIGYGVCLGVNQTADRLAEESPLNVSLLPGLMAGGVLNFEITEFFDIEANLLDFVKIGLNFRESFIKVSNDLDLVRVGLDNRCHGIEG